MQITTAKDIEEKDNTRYARWGITVLIGLCLLALIPRASQRAPSMPERLPPALKQVLFRISPSKPAALAIVLTSEDGEQQALEAATPTELRLAGKIFWTVTALGYRASTGSFEVPYGESVRPVEVEVELVPQGGGRVDSGRKS